MSALHAATRFTPVGCLVPFPLFYSCHNPSGPRPPSSEGSSGCHLWQYRKYKSAGFPALAAQQVCACGALNPCHRTSPGIPVSSNTNNHSAFLYSLLQTRPLVKLHYVFAPGENHRHGSPSKLAENQLILTEIVKSL